MTRLVVYLRCGSQTVKCTQAAFGSLNKGSCKDEVAFEVLREILQLADQNGKADCIHMGA